MTIVADTYKTEFKEEYSQGKSISAGDYKKVLINWNKRSRESSVFIKYHQHTMKTDFSGQLLTELTSDMSTSSFNEIWEEEEDEYWNSYLENWLLKFIQGDIVLVPFPFTDLRGKKVRPALIISNATVNKTADVILLGITTQKQVRGPKCIISNADVTRPFKPPYNEMYVSCKKIAVIEKKLIHKKITKLSDKKIVETREKVIGLFQ